MSNTNNERESFDCEASAHLRQEFFATKPTGFTRVWRTFLPYQIWRFLAINLKMIRIISRNHRDH